MKKNYLSLVLLVAVGFTPTLFAQNYMNDIAEKTCACIDEIDANGLSEDELQTSIGVCMISSAQVYSDELKRDHDIDFVNKPSKAGKKTGEILALEMLEVCPNYIMALAGEGDFKSAQVKRLAENGDSNKDKTISTQSMDGMITGITKSDLVKIKFKDVQGKPYEFLWLEYFENSDRLLTDLADIKSKNVIVYYRTMELFDATSNQYLIKKIITDLVIDE